MVEQIVNNENSVKKDYKSFVENPDVNVRPNFYIADAPEEFESVMNDLDEDLQENDKGLVR